MKIDPENPADLPIQIAAAIRNAIVEGRLIVDQRLPTEAELADSFGVSRPTVREALKRLAAQSLIRTQRGATGGAFVNRITFREAQQQQITTSTLLLSMNDVSFETACEARFALERACAPLAALRRNAGHLDAMQDQITRQRSAYLTDEAFCASDVAFHRALVDAAGNPVLSYQLAGAVEAMQPLMNMITFTARSRSDVADLHQTIADAVKARDSIAISLGLQALEQETLALGRDVFAARAAKAP